MRSQILIALVAALASACDSAGMEIVVFASADPGTPTPHTVKLFIGVGAGATGAIAPAPGTRRFPGAMRWDRDPANADDSTPYGDGPARFVFRPGGDLTAFSVVVAVGYDVNGTPTSSAALLGPELGKAHLKVYSIGLNAITDPAIKPNGYNGLALWGPASARARDDSCVFVQNTYFQPASLSGFIVSPGDHDCDGFADQGDRRECVPEVWFGKRTAARDEINCLTKAPTASLPAVPSCVLGGPACIDGVGPDTSCTASKYCTHPAICEATLCGTGPGAWPCARDVRLAPGANVVPPPTITCDVTVTPGSTGGDMPVCGVEGTFDLRGLGLPAAAMCGRPQVLNRDQPLGDVLIDGNAKYKIGLVDNSCTLRISGDGEYPGMLNTPPPLSGLLMVDLQAAMHSLAFPIVFKPVISTAPTCAPPVCHLSGPMSNALAGCLAAPP